MWRLILIIFLCNCLAIFLKDSFSINHNILFLIFRFCLYGLNQKYIKFGPWSPLGSFYFVPLWIKSLSPSPFFFIPGLFVHWKELMPETSRGCVFPRLSKWICVNILMWVFFSYNLMMVAFLISFEGPFWNSLWNLKNTPKGAVWLGLRYLLTNIHKFMIADWLPCLPFFFHKDNETWQLVPGDYCTSWLVDVTLSLDLHLAEQPRESLISRKCATCHVLLS